MLILTRRAFTPRILIKIIKFLLFIILWFLPLPPHLPRVITKWFLDTKSNPAVSHNLCYHNCYRQMLIVTSGRCHNYAVFTQQLNVSRDFFIIIASSMLQFESLNVNLARSLHSRLLSCQFSQIPFEKWIFLITKNSKVNFKSILGSWALFVISSHNQTSSFPSLKATSYFL